MGSGLLLREILRSTAELKLERTLDAEVGNYDGGASTTITLNNQIQPTGCGAYGHRRHPKGTQ